MFEAEVSLEKARLPQTTVVGHSSYMHAHTDTYTHTHTHTHAHAHTHTHRHIHACAHTHTHTHMHTHTRMRTRVHISGNLLTDGIYCAGEETVPQPASGTAGRGGQGIEKPKRGSARTTLKATTNSSTVKERAGVRSRGLTGKGASTSDVVCCCLNKASEVFLMHAYPSGCRGVKARNVHVSKSPMHMHIMPFIWHQVFPVARNQGPAAVARNQAPLAGIQAPLPQLRYALYVSFLSAWPLISMTDTVKFSPSGNLVQR